MVDLLKKYKAWIFMVFALVLNMIFAILVLLPAFQMYVQADGQLGETEAAIEATQQASGDDMVLLQLQFDRLNETFASQVNHFVNESQVEQILNSLFSYADESGVVIANMQLQPSTANGETVYNRIFRLQVEGDPTRLMDFVVHFREASIRGVQVQNPVIANSKDNAVLSMDVAIYISPLADGSVLMDIPELEMPVPVTPFPTFPAPTETPLPAVPPGYEGTPGAGNSSTTAATTNLGTTNTGTVDASGNTVSVDYTQPGTCGDAPVPWFAVGDTVVVDFNTQTTLRILAEPRVDGGDANILANVSDNAILQIIGGPVCGQWEGQNVWYWQVQYGTTVGWAGEANRINRWMCSVEDPECV